MQEIVEGPDTTRVPRTAGERAVFDGEDAVKADPEDPDARAKLAAAYIAVGDLGGAIREGKIAIKLNEEFARGHFVLGLAYKESGNTKNAIKHLELATTLEGDIAEFYHLAFNELADVYIEAGEYEKAIDVLTKALGNNPEAADIRYKKAQALEEMGNVEEAIYDYRYILDYIPDHGGAKNALKRLGVTVAPLSVILATEESTQE